jgi:predicted nucleic acid-binding protein
LRQPFCRVVVHRDYERLSDGGEQGRITPTQSDAFIADLGKLGIERDDEAPNRAFTYLLPLCRRLRLTSYDAIYLDLAVRRNLPLATLDEDYVGFRFEYIRTSEYTPSLERRCP